MNASKRLAIKQAIQDRLLLEEQERWSLRREFYATHYPEQAYGGDGPWNDYGGDDRGLELARQDASPVIPTTPAPASEDDFIPF